MKYLLMAFAMFALVVSLLGGFVLLGYNSFLNQSLNFEVGIQTQFKNNQNVYDNGYKRVQEMAQVPKLQQQALQQLFVATISARQYDKGGELMKFIQEQNPNLDQRTFIKIQQAIEEYRQSFQNSQTELLSKKQAYLSFLTATTNGRFNNQIASLLGSPFPRIDLNKIDIVTSDKTQRTFDTLKDEPLNLLQ